MEGFNSTCFYLEEIIVAVIVWGEGIRDFHDAVYHIYVIVKGRVLAALIVGNDEFDGIDAGDIPLMIGVDEIAARAIAKPPLPEGNIAEVVVTLIFKMNGIVGKYRQIPDRVTTLI